MDTPMSAEERELVRTGKAYVVGVDFDATVWATYRVVNGYGSQPQRAKDVQTIYDSLSDEEKRERWGE